MKSLPSRLKALRTRIGMSQAEFAEAYGLPVGSLRAWEIGRRLPETGTGLYLYAIERAPEVMRKIIAGEQV